MRKPHDFATVRLLPDANGVVPAREVIVAFLSSAAWGGFRWRGEKIDFTMPIR